MLKTRIRYWIDEDSEETGWAEAILEFSYIIAMREYDDDGEINLSSVYLLNGTSFIIDTPFDKLSAQYQLFRKNFSITKNS